MAGFRGRPSNKRPVVEPIRRKCVGCGKIKQVGFKKYFIPGAISKFDGHVFTFNFKKKKEPCLKCFYQGIPSDEILNCEAEGILGPIAGIVGNIQANEALKIILDIGKNLRSNILILNFKDLDFKKVKFNYGNIV